MKIKFLLLFCLFAANCSAQSEIKMFLNFNGQPLILNKEFCTSECGNFSVCGCKFFMCSPKIIRAGKETVFQNAYNYFDADIQSSLIWQPDKKFKLKKGDTVEIVFGLDSINNKNYRFKNAPESLMFWPDVLGGGYHYMKTDIRYTAYDSLPSVFNCHLGRGRICDEDNQPIQFLENFIKLKFAVYTDNELIIDFDIMRFFGSYPAVDFNNYGGIMDDQQAMSFFIKRVKETMKTKQ